MREVTVFGGSGFVGRAIVQALASEGARVRVASRHPARGALTKTAGDPGQVVPVLANVRYPDSVAAAVRGVDAVINASGVRFSRGKQSYRAVHAAGAGAIAAAAKAAGVARVVHVSGLGAEDRPGVGAFIRSKADAERAMNQGFPGVTILRPSVVFGPGDAFFERLGLAAALAPVMPLVGDGTARVQPVYVGDLALAAVRALQNPGSAFATYELGGPRVYTMRAIAELVLAMTGRDRRIVSIPASLAYAAGFFAEFVPLLPPPLTRDQVELMTTDNVVRPGAMSFPDLGIVPTAAEAILPSYLDRYRVGGRYNVQAPA